MLEAMVNSCAGLDVHRRQVVCTLIREGSRRPGSTRLFIGNLKNWPNGFRREQVELAVMESTGIYWKAVFACLEDAGIEGRVVNARHVKQVPGRKTDVCDSEWLGRTGPVRSFAPKLYSSRGLA